MLGLFVGNGPSDPHSCIYTQVSDTALSRSTILHQRRAVCFSPFLSACLRLLIQISSVHPDLYRTSPLIQPFSSCHRSANWSVPDVSSWHVTQMVTGGCGVPGCAEVVCCVVRDKRK